MWEEFQTAGYTTARNYELFGIHNENNESNETRTGGWAIKGRWGGGATVIERGTEVCHTCTGSSHVLAA